VESGATSPKSPMVWTTTLPLPSSPTKVSATATGDTAVVLTWQQDVAHGELPVSAYQVLRGTTSGDLTKIATVTAATFTNESLSPNTTYYYEVVAIDTGGDSSSPSSEVSAKTP